MLVEQLGRGRGRVELAADDAVEQVGGCRVFGDGRFEADSGRDLDGEAAAWPIPTNRSGDGVDGGNFVVEFTVRSELKRRLQNENLPAAAIAEGTKGAQP